MTEGGAEMIAHLYMGQMDGRKLELDFDERPEVLWIADVENQEYIDQAEAEDVELSEQDYLDLSNLAYILAEERYHPDGTLECLYEYSQDATVAAADVESDTTLDN